MAGYKVTVGKVGAVKVEANGFTGGSCKEATASLLRKISGGRDAQLTVEDKPEMYMESTEQEVLHN